MTETTKQAVDDQIRSEVAKLSIEDKVLQDMAAEVDRVLALEMHPDQPDTLTNYNEARGVLKLVVKSRTTLEKTKKEVKDPYWKVCKAIDGEYNRLHGMVVKLEKPLANKLNVYDEVLELRNTEREALADWLIDIPRKALEANMATLKSWQRQLAEHAVLSGGEDAIAEYFGDPDRATTVTQDLILAKHSIEEGIKREEEKERKITKQKAKEAELQAQERRQRERETELKRREEELARKERALKEPLPIPPKDDTPTAPPLTGDVPRATAADFVSWLAGYLHNSDDIELCNDIDSEFRSTGSLPPVEWEEIHGTI